MHASQPLAILALFLATACGDSKLQSTEATPAAKLVRDAANGDEQAMENLEGMLTEMLKDAKPVSTDTDPDKAVSKAWLQGESAVVTLADAGNAHAMFSLGDSYLKYGKDQAKAHVWLKDAAALGHTRAQFIVGKHLLGGLAGFEIDTAKGRELLEAAAKAGDGEAAFVLGINLRYGLGLTQDLPAALERFNHAVELGFKEATSEVTSLAKELGQ